jgi:alpha-2-macroglobulin
MFSGALAAAQSGGDASLQSIDPAVLSAEATRQEGVEDNLKRGNVDLGQSTIQYWTASPAATAAGSYPPDKENLAIVDYAPTGELPVEMRRPTVYVMFNLPMVPVAKLGQPISSTPLMTITPSVGGVYRWYGTKVLSFQPDAAMLDQPRYVVTVSKDATSLGGRRLGKSFAFEFHTETVKIVNFHAGRAADAAFGETEVPTAEARYLVLEFNQNVDPSVIKRFLAVKIDGMLGGRQLSFAVGRPSYPPALRSRTDRGLLLTLADDPPEKAKLVVTLRDKATPFEAYPVRSGDQSFSLQTVTPFLLKSLESYSYDLPLNNKPGTVPVYARFSHAIARSLQLGSISVAVNGKPVQPTAVEVFGDTLRIGLAGVEPGDGISLRATEAVTDVYGRALSNARTTISAKIPRPEPIASFPWGFHHLESSYPPKFLWAGRNLDALSLGSESSDRFRFDLEEREKSGKPYAKPVDISRWKQNRVNYAVMDLKNLLNPAGFGTAYFSLRDSYTSEYNGSGEKRAFAIQVTNLGITTRIAYNNVLVWVNSLSGGLPVKGATVELGPDSDTPVLSGETDEAGLVSFPLKPGQFTRLFGADERSYNLVVSASKDGDRADLKVEDTADSYNSTVLSHQTVTRAQTPISRILAFSDRGLYKPGEELALRGIHWIQGPEGFSPYAGDYSLELKDPRSGKLIWSTKASTSENGGFSARFKLPKDVEPGDYYIAYRHDGPASRIGWDEDNAKTGVYFTVALFRKLSFQVKANVPDRLYYVGDEAATSVEASYLGGGSMPGAGYSYYWTRKPMPFAPPGPEWRDYVFGPGTWEGERNLASGKGNLSPAGQAQISVSTADQNAMGAAYDYTLETTVQDVDRQAIAATTHLLVHPASFYLGLRFSNGSTTGWWSRFVSTGQDVKADLVLVDPRGAPWTKATNLTATIIKGDWRAVEQQGVYGRINTRWNYVETKVSSETVAASEGRAAWTFGVKESGDYLLVLEGRDAEGRLSKTVARFYATGSSWVRRATETPSDIQLIADKDLYLPGETAHILVRSPIEKGDYLLTTEREDIYESRILHLEGGKTMVDVPIVERYLPVFYVALSSYTKREAPPADVNDPDLGRPRSLFGILGLRVSTKPVELEVEVSPGRTSYLPGKEATVTVRVTRGGDPVAGAEVTALAVDRGVLDLIDYHVPDPVKFFYNALNFPLAVDGDDSRRLLMRPLAFDTSALTGGDGDKLPERADYRPLALFDPFAKTDDRGEATMRFQLPDSLTTYRLTAFVVSGSRVGVKEGELLVQNPVNVRAALPRRLRNRDTVAAGVVMKNLTSEPQKVEVTAESAFLSIGGQRTKSVEIPANGSCELPFILSATAAGEGKVTFTVRSAVVNERVSDTVIVEEPLVKEAFSTVGFIPRGENSATEGLVLPSAVAPGYGELSFLAGSTLRPCIEPSFSRLLALPSPWWSHYDRLLYSFAAVYVGEGKDRIIALAKELRGRQQPDGGVYTGSYNWKPYLSDPYVSLLTAHFLEYAASRKFRLDEAPDLGKLLVYLDGLAAKYKDFDPYFHAYANYVLAAGGKADRSYLSKTEAQGDKLGLGGYGLLAEAYLAAGDRGASARAYKRCKNFVMMGTQTVDLKNSYEVENYWSSGLAELAILLRNSFDQNEDAGLVQRIATSLGRGSRRWRRLNDDLWTLLGFLPLLDAEGKDAAKAAVVIAAADQNLATLSLSPQTPAASKTLDLAGKPLSGLPRDRLLPVSIGKIGATPLYYTMILRYALPNETAFARDEGIEVEQRYETLDGDKVGEKDLKLGETYRVRVDVSSAKRRSRLELLVPVPSGLEIVDPTFVTSGKFLDKGGAGGETIKRETVYGDTQDVVAEGYASWNDGEWELYFYRPDSFALDNMMVYRWTDFYAGARTITFLVRVTTPGIYPTPPAQASLEFEPEVFGRSEGKLFVVKP